ncbi:leucine-rich repeat-containing protein 74A isoform X3 [Entelurus aequoreus]|uniref:leucine-rich repeat-containing protein 74A isoform X3 n=1 Tax=Entelurus aequoreus TaxID=161455 RepID=UPI002B1E68EE|nr:leucine-rich repeat-containing protein 74A isoform X3 [Entelurus aequoreus]
MSSLSFESLCLEDNKPSTILRQDLENELHTDLELDEMNRYNETSVADIYQKACKLVGVVPVSYIIQNLNSPTMKLSHQSLGPLGCKALSIALVSDLHINTLELSDNDIRAEGAKHLAEMLRANFTIQHLDLCNNHLHSTGAEYMCRMLMDSTSLKSIKLSGNGFIDDDAKYFADALTINLGIKELDLSHNRFCGRGGEHLGFLLANNDSLEVLNLCWNQLRMKGAVALCAGLKVNLMVKHLDLSWNGFGNEGALAMGEALKFNNTLVHLNLSNNRITNEGVSMLCKGLEYNGTLQILLLAYNSLTVEGALALVNMVKNTHKTALEEINIQDYLDQHKLRLWDFFRNIDKDATMRVPVADFRNAVQQSSVPLDRFQIEELIQRLDRDRTGMVDYRGLADTRKQMMRNHRQQLRKVASRQKKEKHKSDRILKTFQIAVEAVTPHGSVVISPGDPREEPTGPYRFSATPLSSWHHFMSNSEHTSVSNPRRNHVHLPTPTGSRLHHFTKSPILRSHSQPNFLAASPLSAQGKFTSAQAVHSNPEMRHSKIRPALDHLTKSRAALDNEQIEIEVTNKKGRKTKAKKFVEKYSNNPTMN